MSIKGMIYLHETPHKVFIITISPIDQLVNSIAAWFCRVNTYHSRMYMFWLQVGVLIKLFKLFIYNSFVHFCLE